MDARAADSIIECNLANLPVQLEPLKQKSQWVLWKAVARGDGSFNKPPYDPKNPDKHAATDDPSTWSDYNTALTALCRGEADGLGFVLTEGDGLACLDLDRCRDRDNGNMTDWSHNVLEQAAHTYIELSPSGRGVHVWGLAQGDYVLRKLALDPARHGEKAAIEVYRNAGKYVTITGVPLSPRPRPFNNIDMLCDWAVAFGEINRKPQEDAQEFDFNWSGFGLKYSDEQIEEIVKNGAPAGTDRSALFHSIVGHYKALGWTGKEITRHLRQSRNGIANKYIAENRLPAEVHRSLKAWARRNRELPQQEPLVDEPAAAPEPEDHDAKGPEVGPDPDQSDTEQPKPDDPAPGNNDTGDTGNTGGTSAPPLPPPPRSTTWWKLGQRGKIVIRWLIKGAIRQGDLHAVGGEWGAGKTTMLREAAANVMTGTPFAGKYEIAHKGGVLWLAYEDAQSVEPGMTTVLHEKHGITDITSVPFYCQSEKLPRLSDSDAGPKPLAIIREIAADCQKAHGEPLVWVIIDTFGKAANYRQSGADKDAPTITVYQSLLEGVMKAGDVTITYTDHSPKNGVGLSGSQAKESGIDDEWGCQGTRQPNGRVGDLKLVLRKVKGAESGAMYPYEMRSVPVPGLDGETSPIIEWTTQSAWAERASKPVDPWDRRDKGSAIQLKRALMTVLARHGASRRLEPDGPEVRMIEAQLVRDEFEATTFDVEGQALKMRFNDTLKWAVKKSLVGARTINEVQYLWLQTPDECS